MNAAVPRHPAPSAGRPLMLPHSSLLFLLPIAARAALSPTRAGRAAGATADWSSVGHAAGRGRRIRRRASWSCPAAPAAGRASLSVHSLGRGQARERHDAGGATTWSAGAIRCGSTGWATGRPLVRRRAARRRSTSRASAPQALIPKIEAAIKEYRYANDGDYRIWPGPNSNTFVAAVLRAIPEAGVTLPPNAIGRDFRPLPYVGLTDSGTGVELTSGACSASSSAGSRASSSTSLGLVAGLDLRDPGVKLPGFGRIGFAAADRDRRAERALASRRIVLRRRAGDGRAPRSARLPPCTTPCRCSNKSPSPRSAAAGSTRCRSTSAIAATSPACIATSARARTAPRR